MHDIVAYTRARVRDDRPVHLLGIGGVRDIFHGVRQGIDTFDCVHPSRLGRHGGALVLASHWDEEPHPEAPVTPMTVAAKLKVEKMEFKRLQRLRAQQANQQQTQQPQQGQEHGQGQQEFAEGEDGQPVPADGGGDGGGGGFKKRRDRSRHQLNKKLRLTPVVREHINVCKGPMRNDPRPLDASCGCYTCRRFSRAYLHHLFKAKETLGGTLVRYSFTPFLPAPTAPLDRAVAESNSPHPHVPPAASR